MEQEDYQQVKKIFQSAVEIVPEERAGFLDKACQGNKALRQEVELLLNSEATQIIEKDIEPEPPEDLQSPKIRSAEEEKQAPDDLETEVIDFSKTNTLVGEILDERFLIKKDLTDSGADEGGIGLVYLAEDLKLMSKETVVKILKAEALESDDIARKFLHEKEALIRLDHPNIVRILDAGTLSDNNPFMVMEFIPGYSLRSALKKQGKLPFDLCAYIIRKVTDALSAAHSEKIIHRDIKPENIMLTPKKQGYDRVRLIDFGIARVEESELAPATTIERGIGTVLYMAPEQLLGKLEQTPAVDIYAIAIVAYEMLTGKRLFDPKSIVEMYQLQKEGLADRREEFLEELPEKVVGLLLSALEFEAEKRPQNARQFGLELAQTLRWETDYQKAAKPSRSGDVPVTDLSVPPNRTDDNLIPLASSENIPVRGTESLEEASQSVSEKTAQSEIIGFNSVKKITVAGVGLFLFIVISGVGGLVYWQRFSAETANSTDTNSASVNITKSIENLPTREIPFYLNVQKMREGKPFEEPYRSSGRNIYESGDEFQMVFESVPKGFFYLFVEASKEEIGIGGRSFNILFPTPLTNLGLADEGLALVKDGQNIVTNVNELDKNKGIEFVWVIWTKDKQPELENVRNIAFKNEGEVSDEEGAYQLKEFINKYKSSETKAEEDKDKQQTIIKSRGDILIHKIELEHR